MSLEEKEIESKSPSPNSHIDHQMSEEVTTKINLFESDSPSPNSHIDHQKSAEVTTKINLFESESLSPNDIDHKPNDHEMSEEVTTTIRQNQCTCKFSPDHWTYRYLILHFGLKEKKLLLCLLYWEHFVVLEVQVDYT